MADTQSIAAAQAVAQPEIHKLLRLMVQHNASDLHIKVGQPPVFRIGGTLTRMQKVPPLTPEGTQALIRPMMSQEQFDTLTRIGSADFAYAIAEVGRFRVNIFLQRGSTSAAIRKVNLVIPNYEQLGLPPQISRCAQCEQGLILIGGVTGSGKSTTLAAILDDINANNRDHILTIEDPIEYVFEDKQSIVNQREVGIDVMDFKAALRAAVREDPDTILIGEMRDAETVETALTAAETGHLVFGTIHASGCAQTLGRILDLFPQDKHPLIRKGLAFNLRCVLNQKLLKGTTKERMRIPALEIMFLTPIIRKLILEEQDNKIADAIKQDTENGCESYNQALIRLFRQKLISEDTAMRASPNGEELRMSMRGISISDSGGIV